MADNTFLGLQPYTEDDAYRFKGRTEESQELFRLILRNDFTVCYAESGEGKTSLLNAGVFPLLRENMNFPIVITFTSDDYKLTPDNFDAIIDRCIKDSIAEYNEKNKGVNVEYKLCSTDFQESDSQAELQRELSKYSWWKLRNYKPQAMGLTFIPVFVFDQFEEVFNLPGSIAWTKKFFDWLEEVSSDSCPEEIAKKIRGIIGNKSTFPTIKEEKGFKAVFSLRKEFIGELDYWGMQTHFIPALKDNRYCLKALTYEGAKKVMTQQERFDESKVEQVLTHFVGQYSREPERTIAENLPAIPALLLSVVCNSWEKDIYSFAGVNESNISNSLEKILGQFYNKTISTAVSKCAEQNDSTSTASIQKEIETAMSALVDANGKRIRTKTTSSALTQIEFDKKYKKVLSDAHIIRVIKIDGEDYVEVVHDSLCAVIVRKEIEKFTEGNVFISYKHEDEQWAKWLQYKLEHFKLPTSLQKENPNLPRTIRVLNYSSELMPGVLSEQISETIKRSKYLIVLCSPRSAKSAWVNKEVETFISLGRTEQILPLIIKGEPYAIDSSLECFPEALRQLPEGKELLGVNVNETGRDLAVVKLIARMLNVRFDALWQRHKREQRFKQWLILACVLLMALISTMLSGYFYYQNQNYHLAEKRLVEANNLNKVYGDFGLMLDKNVNNSQKESIIKILNNMVQIHDKTLWMSQFEFTVGQWYGILDKPYDESLRDMPMTNVSYGDIYMFIMNLQDMTNVEFGLPTVEEWEYAARGGENTVYSGSEDVYRVAWFKDNSDGHAHPCDGLQGHEPNTFDIYDMSGNVSEMCNTPYNDSGLYTVCGGDFNSPASDVTITSRKGIGVNERSETIGFRLVVRRTPIYEPCKGCNGTGLNGTLTCPTCGGTGHVGR